MLHAVELRAGRAPSYRNRWIRPVHRGGTANTHIIQHAGVALALAEAHLPVALSSELDPSTPRKIRDGFSASSTTAREIAVTLPSSTPST